MPILNYTTGISVQKTAGEIQEILARAGARTVVIEFGDDRIPEAIVFQIAIGSKIFTFRLPSQWHGVYQSLLKSGAEKRYKTEDQARKVAWRIIKDWTEAQVAIIEAGAAEIRYLCKLVTPTNGIVLDPFMGSGTTGCAAQLEGFNFIGFEKEEDYFNIAKLQIQKYTGLF
jgi:hypothetical protein